MTEDALTPEQVSALLKDAEDSKEVVDEYGVFDMGNSQNTISAETGEKKEEKTTETEKPYEQQQQNIQLLLDIYMQITVELGRTKKKVKDILGWGEGSIIELDKPSTEPVDILVNRRLVARGEVVVIDENFGVRITEIVDPRERLLSLTR